MGVFGDYTFKMGSPVYYVFCTQMCNGTRVISKQCRSRGLRMALGIASYQLAQASRLKRDLDLPIGKLSHADSTMVNMHNLAGAKCLTDASRYPIASFGCATLLEITGS